MNTGTHTVTPEGERHGMHLADQAAEQAPVDPMTDHERIEALEAEVDALKASNACLVQTVDVLRGGLGKFYRTAGFQADELSKMAAKLAAKVIVSEADQLEMNEPG